MKALKDKEPYSYSLDPRSHIVCGVDEAGRGPLVGPVVAACVVLNYDDMIEGLDDSKKLSEKKRLALFDEIVNRATSVGVGMCLPREIDEMNILHASLEAMRRAYLALNPALNVNLMLVDGNKTVKNVPCMVEAVVGGDARVKEIAAASIVAKCIRDREMTRLSLLYPQYGFDRHKGYPTKAHLELLQTLPLLDCYRTGYGPIANLIDRGHKIVPADFTFECGINSNFSVN